MVEVRNGMENFDAPLRASVSNGILVIEIGIDTLQHAAENCPALYDGTVENCDPPYCKVVDKFELANSVKREMFHEREDGSSPISDLLDEAIVAAIEDGSEAFAYDD